MPKIDVETTKFILNRNITDVRKVAEIMSEIEMELKAQEEEKANKPPAVKKQFCIIISDPDGTYAEKDITGWVVQIPEDDAVSSVVERSYKACYEFNTTPKGRRMPIETIGEGCECVGAKFFKEQNLFVKTKTPVLVVATPNKIPTEKVE